MLSSVLKSKTAILANIEIMRTFSRFRDVLSAHKDLARQLDALEGRCEQQRRSVERLGAGSVISPAPAAQRQWPMAMRDDLANGRADAGLQAAAAEEQIGDERQKPPVDLG
jgi:hypothetical protein